MSLIYISDPGSVIGISGNRFTVNYKDGRVRSIASETVEGITLLGISQLTTQCMEECMKRGIPVAFMSKGGKYFGRLVSTGHIKAELQRKQSSLYDTAFAVDLAKILIKAKIRNQETILRRYSINKSIKIDENIHDMKVCENKIETCNEINEITGYEGQAAKCYFKGLSKCIDDKFHFDGRSKRPPKDEFNSMISLKLAKFLSGFGDRIQKSAFEVHLTEKKFEKMKNNLSSFCREEDSIRLYKLSGRTEVTKWGIDKSTTEEDIILI